MDKFLPDNTCLLNSLDNDESMEIRSQCSVADSTCQELLCPFTPAGRSPVLTRISAKLSTISISRVKFARERGMHFDCEKSPDSNGNPMSAKFVTTVPFLPAATERFSRAAVGENCISM